MQKLTQDEMKDVNASGSLILDGCNKAGTKCCIRYYDNNNNYLGVLCGTIEWYLEA
jgi:hypothetical protein